MSHIITNDEININNTKTMTESDTYEAYLEIPSQPEKSIKWIKEQPQHEQRSPEWYEMRETCLTASSAASALGMCEYKSVEQYLVDKVGFGPPFRGSSDTFHGVMLEDVAKTFYERIYGVYVEEFGLIKHPEHRFLGASPDGIVCGKIENETIHQLDNNNPLLGRMLEIKCPSRRKINPDGNPKGDICPLHYWVQVQLQMECCNLEYCDFLQCTIVLFDSEAELQASFEKDLNKNNTMIDVETTNNDTKLYISKIFDSCNMLKFQKYLENNKTEEQIRDELSGVFVRTMPRREFGSDFPTYDEVIEESEIEHLFERNNMKIAPNITKRKEWCNDINKKYETNNDNNCNKLSAREIESFKWWRIVRAHNVTIRRDREWFKEQLPLLSNFWDKVVFYRSNLIQFHKDYCVGNTSKDIDMKIHAHTSSKNKNNASKKESYPVLDKTKKKLDINLDLLLSKISI